MTEPQPNSAEARGFALYVGIDEAKAAASGSNISEIVLALKSLLTELAPAAESHAAVAFAPAGQRGRDLDIVRLALRDPAAVATLLPPKPKPSENGVVIDISRKRVLLNAAQAPLTFKEFELLQYLVLREGQTVDRDDIVRDLWNEGDSDQPNSRTIDVHVRRLRAKLEPFDDIIRTVRGVGYRFDRHADVAINFGHGRGIDAF
ncbi:MAG: hypothetical protein RL431_542 [Actinomycetota bacterium]|jgi:DNA-binding response OmpR family regulator